MVNHIQSDSTMGDNVVSKATTEKKEHSTRKSNKPLMEKRRRARINNCLDQLKILVLQAHKKDSSQYSKLEKADILEMTVQHLRQLQREQLNATISTDPGIVTKYRAGFNECASEVVRYLGSVQGINEDVRLRISNHLAGCIRVVNIGGVTENGNQMEISTTLEPETTMPMTTAIASAVMQSSPPLLTVSHSPINCMQPLHVQIPNAVAQVSASNTVSVNNTATVNATTEISVNNNNISNDDNNKNNNNNNDNKSFGPVILPLQAATISRPNIMSNIFENQITIASHRQNSDTPMTDENFNNTINISNIATTTNSKKNNTNTSITTPTTNNNNSKVINTSNNNNNNSDPNNDINNSSSTFITAVRGQALPVTAVSNMAATSQISGSFQIIPGSLCGAGTVAVYLTPTGSCATQQQRGAVIASSNRSCTAAPPTATLPLYPIQMPSVAGSVTAFIPSPASSTSSYNNKNNKSNQPVVPICHQPSATAPFSSSSETTLLSSSLMSLSSASPSLSSSSSSLSSSSSSPSSSSPSSTSSSSSSSSHSSTSSPSSSSSSSSSLSSISSLSMPTLKSRTDDSNCTAPDSNKGDSPLYNNTLTPRYSLESQKKLWRPW